MNLFKSFSKRDQTSSIRKKRLTIALSPLLIGACLFVLARLNGHFADETALKERGTVTMGSVVGYDEGAHRVWYEFEFLHDRYRGYARVDNASFNTAFETGNIGVVYLKEAPTINSVYNSINQVDLWVMIPFFSESASYYLAIPLFLSIIEIVLNEDILRRVSPQMLHFNWSKKRISQSR